MHQFEPQPNTQRSLAIFQILFRFRIRTCFDDLHTIEFRTRDIMIHENSFLAKALPQLLLARCVDIFVE